jgi:hypothetical protein
MGYYMRYITTDTASITLANIEKALKEIDSDYSIINTQLDDLGDLMYQQDLCGQIEINRADDDIFEDDRQELKELVQGIGNPNEKIVLDTLEKACTIVAVEAIWEDSDADAVLAKIDPLWDWLFTAHEGLLQADNDGFYNQADLILELNLKL